MTTTVTDQHTARLWRAFMESPAEYTTAHHLFECFGGSIKPDMCQRLLDTARLRPRISALLIRHHELVEAAPAIGTLDAAIALLPSSRFQELALRSGAIFWSASFAVAIAGKAAFTLHEQFGEPLYSFAVSNRDLAGAVRSLEPLKDIRGRVIADGWRCIEAWGQTMPAQIAKRVRLKLSTGDILGKSADGFLMSSGPIIVRRAVNGI